jgi:hypothetical protein
MNGELNGFDHSRMPTRRDMWLVRFSLAASVISVCAIVLVVAWLVT